jgi:Mn-dependent DtxR family transcriptional regulator
MAIAAARSMGRAAIHPIVYMSGLCKKFISDMIGIEVCNMVQKAGELKKTLSDLTP